MKTACLLLGSAIPREGIAMTVLLSTSMKIQDRSPVFVSLAMRYDSCLTPQNVLARVLRFPIPR